MCRHFRPGIWCEQRHKRQRVISARKCGSWQKAKSCKKYRGQAKVRPWGVPCVSLNCLDYPVGTGMP